MILPAVDGSASPITASPQPPDHRPAAILLEGLHKAYGAVRAVDGLDLAIAPGEIVAVLGPNGAGKSTTTEMITGLTDPDAGRVAVFGRAPRAAVRQGLVGVMLQAGALLHEATVNDVLAPDARSARAPAVAGGGDRAGGSRHRS